MEKNENDQDTFPRSWWNQRAEHMKELPEADAKMKEVFLNDRAALTIFAALLMTVNFAAFPATLPSNFIEDNNHNYEIQLLCNFAFGLGTGSSLCTIFVGTWHFLTVNKFSANVHAAIDAVEKVTPVVFQPVFQAFIAVWATICGSLCLVYLNQGWKMLLASGCPLVISFGAANFYGSRAMMAADGAVYGKGASIAFIKSFLSSGTHHTSGVVATA